MKISDFYSAIYVVIIDYYADELSQFIGIKVYKALQLDTA